MDTINKRLKSITQWAESDDQVRVMVLIGSRAQKGKPDRLAGLDLDLFVSEPDALAEQATWQDALGTPWLSHFEYDEDLIIYRSLYDDGLLVALYIQPLSTLSAVQEQLPPYYQPRYKVLVDKDQQTRLFPQATAVKSPLEVPTEECFQTVLEEFWFDAYDAVKYLWRGDLWRSKHYDWNLKQHLFLMLRWQAAFCNGQTEVSLNEGDHLTDWVDPEAYTALMTTFGRFYPADSWRALEDTVRLFTRLAREVAARLDFDYPADKDEKFTALVKDLLAHPRD